MGIASAAALALALSACGSRTDTANSPDATMANDTAGFDAANAGATGANMGAAARPAAGQTFVNTAAASDAFEIASSKLALDNSSSAAIKKYANQMIAAHTASTDKLKATVSGLTPALTPDPTLNADQQAKLDSLKGLTGTAFDTAYIAAQQQAHQQAYDMLTAYGATGDVPALKTFATGLAPTVAAHLNRAKGLKA
jgi:putative membrane protein